MQQEARQHGSMVPQCSQGHNVLSLLSAEGLPPLLPFVLLSSLTNHTMTFKLNILITLHSSVSMDEVASI
jgi:hypothetical protein